MRVINKMADCQIKVNVFINEDYDSSEDDMAYDNYNTYKNMIMKIKTWRFLVN